MLTKNEIKYIRLLQEKKHRDTENRFVVEGTKWIQDLLQWQPGWIETLYTTENWIATHGTSFDKQKIRIIADFELEKISALSHPAPVIAVVCKPEKEKLPFSQHQWNIVLDGIQDPGNLGSIIRIADWFGLPAIWCSTDCADAFNPKVVQATMGSLCRVIVQYIDLENWLTGTNLPVYMSGMEGKSLFDIHEKSGILVIGSEGKGARREIASKATHHITIPKLGHAESLNAAVATGIMVARLTAASEPSKGH